MAAMGTYVVDAFDQEGRAIYESEHIRSTSDKAAWTAAVTMAFEKKHPGDIVSRIELSRLTSYYAA